MSKKLWFASVPSVIFMTTMFVSSTFAWFTDFAVNSGNRVQSGNLAVGFASSETISDGNLSGTIQDLKLNPNEVFNLGNAAQPGDYQERYLRVRNEGNIAIDYEIDFVVNVDSILAEVIDFEIQPLGGSTTTVVGTNIDQGIYISLQDNVQGTGGLLRPSTETPQEFEIWRVKMIYTSRADNTYNDENLVFEVDIRLNAWQFNYQESQGSIPSQSSSSSSPSVSSGVSLTSIVIAGATDVTIPFNEAFNLRTGVTATGNNGMNYTSNITFSSTSSAVNTSTGVLDTTKTGVHAVRYQVSVGSVVVQQWRNITVSATIEADPGNWKIVGTLTDPQWTPSNNTLVLTPVTGVTGSYSIDLDLVLGSQFKVKTGDTWETGRDLGFDKVTSVKTGLFSNEGENIYSLVSGKFRVTYTFAPSAGTITIDPLGWIGYSTVVTQGATSTSIAYENPTPADWVRNTQLRLTAPFDQAKEGVEFDFTGKAGDEYLFKVEGPGVASERMVTATGNPQTHIITLSNFTPSQRATLNLFVIFARTSGSAGTIVVRDWKYVDSVTPVAPVWRAEGGATATMNGNAMTFTYTARVNFWDQNAQLEVLGFDSTKTSLTVAFTGVATQQYMFSVEFFGGRREFIVTATGAAQTTTLDLSSLTQEERASINKFVIFSYTMSDAGSITVTSWN
jgi:hypothetical protein